MRYIKNNLALVAFIAASVSAFAFNGLDPEDPDPNRAFFTKIDGEWELASENHICVGSTNICVAQFENDDPQNDDLIYEKAGNYIAQ